jgi:hypothetical protein
MPQIRPRTTIDYNDVFEILVLMPQPKNKYALSVATRSMRLDMLSTIFGLPWSKVSKLTENCIIDEYDQDLILFRSQKQAEEFLAELMKTLYKF